MPDETSDGTGEIGKPAARGRRLPWLLAGIGLAAAALRVLYLMEYARRFPFLNQPIRDAAYYDAWARRALGGNLFPDGPFFHAPGYAWFLSAIYAVLGPVPSHAVFIQALLGVLVTLATVVIAAILFGREEGLLAGILMLGAGTLYFHESKLLVESWALFLLTFSGLAMMLAERRLPVAVSRQDRLRLERAAAEGRKPAAAGRRALALALVAGLLAGAAAVARAGLILIPLVLTIVMLTRAAGRRRPWSTSLLYAAGFVAALLPTSIHNLSKGAPAPVSTDGGLGFYIGNNRSGDLASYSSDSGDGAGGSSDPRDADHAERAGGASGAPDGNTAPDRNDAARMATLAGAESEADSLVVRDLGRTLEPGPESGYWFSRGVKEIAGDLPGWLALEGRKAWRYVNRYERESNGSLNLEASRILWLRVASLPFNFFVAAGVVGLALAAGAFGGRRGARRVLTVPAAVLLCLFATALLLSVTPGLRLPAVPFLAVFAAHALARADAAWRAGRRQTILIVTFVGLAFTALSWPAPAGRARDSELESLLFVETGRGLEARGRDAEAMKAYLEAVNIRPRSHDAWLRMGQLKLKERDLVGAMSDFEHARDAAPGDFVVRNNLGILYYQARRYARADSELAAASRIRPEQPGPLFYRGLVAREQGDSVRAEVFLRQSLEYDPHFTGAYVRLIEILLDQRRPDEARAWANRAGERAVALPPELVARLR